MVEVLGGMFAGRLVTTAYVTADKAKAEMNPPPSCPETLFASIRSARLHIMNLFKMRANKRHQELLFAGSLGTTVFGAALEEDAR